MIALEKFKKSVCFLGTKKDGDLLQLKLGGTGFFIGVQSEKYEKVSHFYLVTAKHCIEQAKRVIEEDGFQSELIIRLNFFPEKVDFIKHGVADSLEAPTDDWIYPDDDAVDIAIRGFNLSQEYTDYIPIADELFIKKEENNPYKITGNQVYAVGLFTQHYGKLKNLPIVRSGIISSMPDELNDDNSGLPYNAYLVELHSIGGLSGSPVFVSLDNKEDLRLLGLIRGHWNLNRKPSPIGFSDDELSIFNSGIAKVSPIEEVTKLLYREDVIRERRRQEEEMATRRGIKPELKKN